jgi:hypothetical protein
VRLVGVADLSCGVESDSTLVLPFSMLAFMLIVLVLSVPVSASTVYLIWG